MFTTVSVHHEYTVVRETVRFTRPVRRPARRFGQNDHTRLQDIFFARVSYYLTAVVSRMTLFSTRFGGRETMVLTSGFNRDQGTSVRIKQQ